MRSGRNTGASSPPASRLRWPPLAHALLRITWVCAAALPLTARAELSNDAMFGPGLRSRPAYDGSSTQRVELVPVVRYFGRLGFVRSTQGVLEAGLRTELTPGLHAGAQLAYEPGRQAGSADFLQRHQVQDVARGASVGLQLEWDHKIGPMPLTLLARVRKHTDTALGMQADLRLSAGVFQQGWFSAGVYTQATWGDAKAADALFGVPLAQAASMGLPPFQAGSGWLFTSLGLLWSVDLGPRWIVVGSFESRRQQGDAERSPLTERSTNGIVSAGLAWRF
jgi:outer membrane scaffolding protein for murein synthesis (MipA/OmpV family)